MTKEEIVRKLRDMAYISEGQVIYLPESVQDWKMSEGETVEDVPLGRFEVSQILTFLADMIEE